MNINAIEFYTLSKSREEKLWKDSLFIFDSSALLGFYFIPENTRHEIYKNILNKLPNRLWIPFHVQYEYLKNRHKVITKPITEKYEPLKKEAQDIVTLINTIPKKIDEIENKTKNNNIHPFLEQTHIEKFKKEINSLVESAKEFNKSNSNIVEEKIKEIKAVEENDDILDAIKNSFSVGREYSFEEIIEITKEGKHRYEFEIPPGYGDSITKNRKKGTQIFGDLIIWKQILEHSKESKKSVIFITNDIKKDEDWCYVDAHKSDRIDRPREELIKEIKDYSGTEFWMYSLPQFLYQANIYLKSDIKEDIIENISKQMLSTGSSTNLTKKVLEIIYLFSDLYPLTDSSHEDEILNSLIKYITVLAPELVLITEENTILYQADLIIKDGEQTVLIELTSAKATSLLNIKTKKLLNMLESTNISNAIIYAPFLNNPNNSKFGSVSRNVDGKSHHVSQVFAKSRK